MAIFFLLCLALGPAFVSHAQYDKDVFSMRGRNALSEGKYALAIENFNILARLDTTDYWNYFFRGIAKYNLGDIRGAQKDFDRSVRLNPVFTNGYHYRGIAKSRQGYYEEGLADIEKAIQLRPGFSGLYFSRGVTYFLAQRFEEALADFDYFIKKEKKEPGAYLNRGACYLYLKDTTRALQDYNRAIRLDRYDPEGYIRRGRLYASTENYDAALKDLDMAIRIDSTSSFAYFYRALLHSEDHNLNAAMADLDKVLELDPGNALTLYNRSLLKAQVGNFNDALDDMDRVININRNNILAYYNRAGFFVQMQRWQDALEDYNMAIALFPDFAKAYMNRSYVERMMGRNKAARQDYEIARRKVAEYRAKSGEGKSSLADTTSNFNSLIALDADFAKKDFDNELLQHRDVDVRLKPLFSFRLTGNGSRELSALSHEYENPLIERFRNSVPLPVVVSNSDTLQGIKLLRSIDSILAGDTSSGAGGTDLTPAGTAFIKGIYEVQQKQYNSALKYFDQAVELAGTDPSRDRYARFYKAFYLMNRGVLRAEMIEFLASMEMNVQTLSMDDSGATRTRVNDRVVTTYDYSEALADMEEASRILPDIPYIYFNLGNLYCLSSQMVNAIESYDKAIELHPYMGDAYYNRGLALIFLKDNEKGCIDLSRAGELGVAEAYGTIAKHCKDKDGEH